MGSKILMQPQYIQTEPIGSEQDKAPHVSGEKKSESTRNFFSLIIIIIAAFFFASLLTSFVFQSYRVDGQSMETTLQNADRLIIWKVPRTIARVTGNSYIPNRGDVIVFVESGFSLQGSGSKQLIKRVIGLPGDRVVIENGELTVYNKEHPNGFNPDKTMPYGENVDLSMNTSDDIDERVGDNQLFVMGDNRKDSLDSRIFGPIEAHNIVGKLAMRIFPLNNAEVF